MVLDNTVLILGAGASKPYGYPTALELRKDIIGKSIPFLKNLMLKNLAGKSSKGEDFESHPYIKNIKKLINVFNKSSISSIDLFLSRNKEYYDIGKQLITLLLANCELKSKFREEISNGDIDWYFNFYDVLTKGIIAPEEISRFSENKVSIITFNYDRSLEYFLYESLTNSFQSKVDEIPLLMQNFKIIHVYGKLAPLPWEDKQGSVEYRSKHLTEHYTDYSKNLQIIYEERRAQTEEIIELIKDAHKIFFLGFGYAEENLSAIGFDQSILKKEQRVFGTAYNLTDNEIIKSIALLRKHNPHMSDGKFILENCDSKMLLRNYLF